MIMKNHMIRILFPYGKIECLILAANRYHINYTTKNMVIYVNMISPIYN